MGELLIRNANIFDGYGSQPFMGDILVHDDRIRELGPVGVLAAPGAELSDVGGLCVSPGFIDVHSHADNAPLYAPPDTLKIAQGVTTEVVGNCGASLAPYEPNADLDQLLRRTFNLSCQGWRSFDQLFREFEARGYGTNMAPMLGHGVVHSLVCGLEKRVVRKRDVVRMARIAEAACGSGCFGLSTGLAYVPGIYAAGSDLAQVVGSMPPGAIYATHMRDEGLNVRQSLDEAVGIAESAQRGLQISHLKIASRRIWGAAGDLLDVLQRARERGVAVHQDVYPYTAASMSMDACLPPWALEGGPSGVVARLEDPSLRERIRETIEGRQSERSWESLIETAGFGGIVVGGTASGAHSGETLVELGLEMGKPPFDAMCDLLVSERDHVKMVAHVIDEHDLRTFMKDKHTMIGSDGAPPGSSFCPHPRVAGTFPRFLGRYVRDLGLMTLSEGIRRITSLPAGAFKLEARGLLRRGYFADIVVFDPEAISDRATYVRPFDRPDGIHHVIINGRIVVRDGECVPQGAGRRLRPCYSSVRPPPRP